MYDGIAIKNLGVVVDRNVLCNLQASRLAAEEGLAGAGCGRLAPAVLGSYLAMQQTPDMRIDWGKSSLLFDRETY